MSANPFEPLLPSEGDPAGRVDPFQFPAMDMSPPPLLPTPDIQAEMIPATGYTNAVLPDEKVGEWTTATPFAVTPLPELTYNPNTGVPGGPAVGLQPTP